MFQVAGDTEVKAQIRLQFRDITGQKCMVIRSLLATQKVLLKSFFLFNGTNILLSLSAVVFLRAIATRLFFLSHVILCHITPESPAREYSCLKQAYVRTEYDLWKYFGRYI